MEEETLNNYLLAGKIAGQALDFGVSLIKPGAKIIDVADHIEKKIAELGGGTAFPVNISFDNVAAHDTAMPNDERVFDKQVVKLDVGVHVNGCVGGDTARTVDLSGSYSDLVKASQDALAAALKKVQIGITLGEIGKEIQQAIESYGYKPVRNLSGHGIGEWSVHQFPSVPNYDSGDDTELEDGMTIAIEPFASTGVGLIGEKGIPYIHSFTDMKPCRNVVVRQVLKELDKYGSLPWTNRWLTRKFPAFKVNYALKEFNQLEILKSYPPLVEKQEGAFISQAEHSLFVGDKVIVMTKI